MSLKVKIENKLKLRFNPIYLRVTNESHLHNVPAGLESHFKIEIVSSHFEEKKLIQRHRMVNEAIMEELAKMRAHSLFTLTPQEWELPQNQFFNSPKCTGGSKLS